MGQDDPEGILPSKSHGHAMRESACKHLPGQGIQGQFSGVLVQVRTVLFPCLPPHPGGTETRKGWVKVAQGKPSPESRFQQLLKFDNALDCTC